MTSSGIITRGYGLGSGRSTIITRGYGDIVDLVEEAVEAVIPGVRRKGRSRYWKRIIEWKPPDQRPVDQYEEICVSVELSELHGAELAEPIRGEVCRKFEAQGIKVDITDVSVKSVGSGTTVEVKFVGSTPVTEQRYHVSASLKHT